MLWISLPTQQNGFLQTSEIKIRLCWRRCLPFTRVPFQYFQFSVDSTTTYSSVWKSAGSERSLESCDGRYYLAGREMSDQDLISCKETFQCLVVQQCQMLLKVMSDVQFIAKQWLVLLIISVFLAYPHWYKQCLIMARNNRNARQHNGIHCNSFTTSHINWQLSVDS